ncbi:hypothetical protein SAMN02745126_06338 [Enhydrobacter aerosaccus]|uniref:Protease inhibitor Inh n=1 Tax=Enhydrobacter aerosaccus TaxID=225324 RepID=A0A1T4TJ75_9HYPH|nr:hypothetical protein [Enhydrobacter aerosaccus]SKA40358.1 hypothetical protein SAMN02745126_06338 [Enhydrobacter aerosaccus]
MTRNRSAALCASLLASALASGPCFAQSAAQAASAAPPQAVVPAAPAAPASFQAPRIALDRGATSCVGLMQDALKLTVEPEHQELSSWHPTQPDSRTFWSVQVDRGGARGSFVGVTPTEDRHCDAETVRVSYLKQDCKAVIAAQGKSAAAAMPMGEATIIQRDVNGRLAMFLPGGQGCVLVEMATLYGR